MEREDEIAGLGNSYSTANRTSDARIARWFSVDPAKLKYPNESSYVANGNRPTAFNDPLGDDYELVINHDNGNESITYNATFIISDGADVSEDDGNSITEMTKTALKNIRASKMQYVFTTDEGKKKAYAINFELTFAYNKEGLTGDQGPINEIRYLPSNLFIDALKKHDPEKDYKTYRGGTVRDQVYIPFVGSSISGYDARGETSTTVRSSLLTVMHEIGHALGFIHPQESKSRTNMATGCGVDEMYPKGRLFWIASDFDASLGQAGIGKYKEMSISLFWKKQWSWDESKYGGKLNGFEMSKFNGLLIKDGEPFVLNNDFLINAFREAFENEGNKAPNNFENGEVEKIED